MSTLHIKHLPTKSYYETVKQKIKIVIQVSFLVHGVIIKIQYTVTYTPPTSIKIMHDNDYEILYGIHKRGNKQEYSEKYA